MKKENQHKKPNWNTADKDFYKDYFEVVKDLKQNMTKAELILWEHLRNKNLGVKFRRQHVIGTFIPDFVALSIKLIIEVDGKIHLQTKKHDAERTELLQNQGYKVIRFTNQEVENNIDFVLEKINNEIDKLTPPNLPKVEGQEQ